MATARVDLGFVNDECDPRLLQSHYFPSKVGGKPAWLSLNPIPKTEQLSCPKCNNPLVFLLQVYSPRDKPEEDAFHRTIFLFACRNSGCSAPNDASNFKVFRSQLPRMNQFFSSDPPPDDPADQAGPIPSAKKYQPLCAVCGCVGPKQCSQCKSVSYCCKDHQTLHWKAGHKKICGKQVPQDPEAEPSTCGALFPEFELEIEEESYNPEKSSKDEAQALQEYQQCVENASPKQPGATLGDQYSEQDLEGMATQETEDDRIFKKFRKRVAQNKEQVLRYNKGGEPLWVSSKGQAKEEDISACSCGAPRHFEFQVMPQLLNHLAVDEKEGNSLDWGTLCVYTCKGSCGIGSNYAEEFIWKQDFAGDSER